MTYAQTKAWRESNPEHVSRLAANAYARRNERDPCGEAEKRRDRHLIRRYGITRADFEAILVAQNNCCKICGHKLDLTKWHAAGKPPCVDHDHSTGEFRGILCRACNILLGACDDDINILLSAIDYLSTQQGARKES